jgi:hypothetical protein
METGTEIHGDRKYGEYMETGNTEIHGDRKYRDTLRQKI